MTRSEIKEVVEEAIEEKLQQFWVDRERHYQHHDFIEKWMKWSDDASVTIRQSVIRAIVLGILGLIALGFFVKFGKQ